MVKTTMTLDQLAGQIRALLETHPGNTPVYIGSSGYGMRVLRLADIARVSKKKPVEIVTRCGVDAVVIR